MTDDELAEMEKRNPKSGEGLHEDAYKLIAEIRKMRSTLRSISSFEFQIHPGIDMMAAHKRLTEAVILARAGLGLPKTGEHAILKPTSGSAANNNAQDAPRRTDSGVGSPKTGAVSIPPNYRGPDA